MSKLSECTRKIKYVTLSRAETAARETRPWPGRVMNVYKCPFCNGYHVGTVPHTENEVTQDQALERIGAHVRLIPSGREVKICSVKRDQAEIDFGGENKKEWYPLSKLKASSVLDTRDGIKVNGNGFHKPAPAQPEPADHEIVEPAPPPPPPAARTLNDILGDIALQGRDIDRTASDIEAAKKLLEETRTEAARMVEEAQAQVKQAELAAMNARKRVQALKNELDTVLKV